MFRRFLASFEAAKAARHEQFIAHQANVSAMIAETNREQRALETIMRARNLTKDEQERYEHNEEARIAQHRMRAQYVKTFVFAPVPVSSSVRRHRHFHHAKVA